MAMKGEVTPLEATILGYLAHTPRNAKNLIKRLKGDVRVYAQALVDIHQNKRRKGISEECYKAAQGFVDSVKQQQAWRKEQERICSVAKELRELANKLGRKHKLEIRLMEFSVSGINFSDGSHIRSLRD